MEDSEIINATTQLSTLRSKPENRWHSNETAADIEVCCRILDEFQRRIGKEAGRKTIRLQERSRGFGRSLGGLCEEMVITNHEMINHIQAFMQHSFEAALNQGSPCETAERGITLAQEILTSSVTIEEGHVTISTICRNFQAADKRKDGIEFLSWLQFLPSDARLQTRLVATMRQTLQAHMLKNIPPTIVIYRIVPNDSEIFTSIKQGAVSQVRSLIGSGIARLRDCNADGQSLLGPRISRFLIECGADLESLEPNNTYSKETAPYVSPLTILMNKNLGNTWHNNEREIMTQLLVAGADLTNAMMHGPDSVFWAFRQPEYSLWPHHKSHSGKNNVHPNLALSTKREKTTLTGQKTLPTVHAALSELPLDQRYRHGRTILHHAAIAVVQEFQIRRYESDEVLAAAAARGLELLVGAGFDVNAQDDDGDTPLHILSASILRAMGRGLLETFCAARASFCGLRNCRGETVAEALRRGVEEGCGAERWADLLWVEWNVEELLREYGRDAEAWAWVKSLAGYESDLERV